MDGEEVYHTFGDKGQQIWERGRIFNLCIFQSPHRSYAAAHPGAQDVLLLLEVADTSAETDREIKIPLYARAGISEVWLINLPGDCVEVYRQPTRDSYQEIRMMQRGEGLAPMALPDLELLVDTILDPIQD